jgi:hypothetical protein
MLLADRSLKDSFWSHHASFSMWFLGYFELNGLYSRKVFQRSIPVNCNRFIAVGFLAFVILLNNFTIIALRQRLNQRECIMQLIRRFNFENFKTERAFNCRHNTPSHISMSFIAKRFFVFF